MGTDNPKVSAYVPQVLKERLKQFREERDISESQAVTIILAEYFQIPEVLGRSSEGGVVGGVTLGRMEALEEKLTDFAALVENRLQQLGEEIGKISRPLVVHQATLDQIVPESEQYSSLLSEPKSELPKPNTLSDEAGAETAEQVLTQEVGTNLELEKDSQDTNDAQQTPVHHEIVDSNKNRPELSLSSESPNGLLSHPVPGKIMAKRLGYHPDSLSKVKTRSTDEEFIALSIDRDPDDIAWKSVKKGRGYLPVNELPSELQTKLLNWFKKNFPEYSP
jgi:hypothetical protein